MALGLWGLSKLLLVLFSLLCQLCRVITGSSQFIIIIIIKFLVGYEHKAEGEGLEECMVRPRGASPYGNREWGPLARLPLSTTGMFNLTSQETQGPQRHSTHKEQLGNPESVDPGSSSPRLSLISEGNAVLLGLKKNKNKTEPSMIFKGSKRHCTPAAAGKCQLDRNA